MKPVRLLLLLAACSLLFLTGNVPAPDAPCWGLAEGDPCQYGYFTSCTRPDQRCLPPGADDYCARDDPGAPCNLICQEVRPGAAPGAETHQQPSQGAP